MIEKRNRPAWPEWAMLHARVAAVRSEDPYVQVGACVLRKDFSVGGTGYNGPPSKVEIDWTDRDARRPLVIHAEVNALRYLIPGEGELVAVTLLPCSSCLTVIASYRIFRVYYADLPEENPEQALALSERTAKELHIELKRIST